MERFESIINGCLKNQRWAQEALYHAFASKMYGVCLRYCKNAEEAQDVLQEGFIKIFDKLHQYKGNGAFEGWVRRVFVNTALEKIRSKKITESIEDYKYTPETEYSEDIISELTTQDLLRIIQDLSPQYKAVFNLYAIEGYSHQEIGELLGISEGTSKSNLSRARSILQEKIKYCFATIEKIS